MPQLRLSGEKKSVRRGAALSKEGNVLPEAIRGSTSKVLEQTSTRLASSAKVSRRA